MLKDRGTEVQRYRGTEGQRYRGTEVRLTLLYNSTLESGYCLIAGEVMKKDILKYCMTVLYDVIVYL